ncbi:MAG TPA: sugar phosphate nucleotidyltransferase [Nitrospiraceae bacterium]|nr:sugar phosphate nucleotidyltransferase [Nitrospiraceae bacterium]
MPCSKEIFPLGLAHLDKAGGVRPKVVCHYLLEKMRLGGAKKAFIILRHGKWDIPEYCGSGSFVDMNLAYLLVESSLGPPHSVDQAFPFVQHARVVFGFPDILFQPDDVFIHLLEKHKTTRADVVLGLFPTRDYRQMDMVQTEEDGRVVAIDLKPDRTDLRFAWICAAWSTAFTRFMHDYLQGGPMVKDAAFRDVADKEASSVEEMSVGHVLKAGLQHGLHIQSVTISTGSYIDIGTPHGLRKALQTVLSEGTSVSS